MSTTSVILSHFDLMGVCVCVRSVCVWSGDKAPSGI